jgi:hypothetical protein
MMETVESREADYSLTFPAGSDDIRRGITSRYRDVSYFGPLHLQELILCFQFYLCSNVWDPRVYSLAALFCIPLIGSALAADQLLYEIIDKDTAHALSDLYGGDVDKVRAALDSLISTPCSLTSLLDANRKDEILGRAPIVERALIFWRRFFSCQPLAAAFAHGSAQLGSPFTVETLLSLQSDAPICRLVDTLLRPILLHLWECLHGLESQRLATRRHKPSIRKSLHGSMLEAFKAAGGKIPVIFFFTRDPRRQAFLDAGNRIPSLISRFPDGTPASAFLIQQSTHLLSSPVKAMGSLKSPISANAAAALGLADQPDDRVDAPEASTTESGASALSGATVALSTGLSLASSSSSSSSSLDLSSLSLSSSSSNSSAAPSLGAPGSLFSYFVPDSDFLPLNFAPPVEIAAAQHEELITAIFALQGLHIFEKHMFPAVAMAYLSAATDGVVTVAELTYFVTRLLSSLKEAKASSQSAPPLSDDMVDHVTFTRLEGSADGGCGPDVVLLHPALRAIYKHLGRSTSTKLIRHVTYSLVEFVTGRRTAKDFPTATDEHGFAPLIDDELLVPAFHKEHCFISTSFFSVMSYVVGASCSIVIPTPERGGVAISVASVSDGNAATSKAMGKAWSGSRYPIIHSTVVQTRSARLNNGNGHFYAIGAGLDALNAPPEGAHLYPSQLCDAFLSKVVQLIDASANHPLPIYYAVDFGTSFRQSKERIAHDEMFPARASSSVPASAGPAMSKPQVSFSASVGANTRAGSRISECPEPSSSRRAETPVEHAPLPGESSISILNFNKSDTGVLKRFLQHFKIKTDRLHISLSNEKVGDVVQRSAIITFPDSETRGSFLDQYRACASEHIIGYRLNISPERSGVKSSSYDHRNAFNIHRSVEGARLTPNDLAAVLESLHLNKALMKPREQQQVANRVRTQARILHGSTPGSKVDLLLLPDLALALRIHRLLLAASTRGGPSPLSSHGFHLSQLLSPPETVDSAWHLPRKPWLPRSPGSSSVDRS